MLPQDALVGEGFPLHADVRLNLRALKLWQALPSASVAADPPRVWRSCLSAARHDLAELSPSPEPPTCFAIDATPCVEVRS